MGFQVLRSAELIQKLIELRALLLFLQSRFPFFIKVTFPVQRVRKQDFSERLV